MNAFLVCGLCCWVWASFFFGWLMRDMEYGEPTLQETLDVLRRLVAYRQCSHCTAAIDQLGQRHMADDERGAA